MVPNIQISCQKKYQYSYENFTKGFSFGSCETSQNLWFLWKYVLNIGLVPSWWWTIDLTHWTLGNASVVLNYTNPLYGVSTIWHQVRCLRWGHPGLFYTATSLFIWYKMFCLRDISYRLIWYEWNLWTCFPCMRNLGRTGVLIDELLRF